MAGDSRDPKPRSKARNWTRSDKISLCAVIAATLAFFVSLIQPAISLTHYMTRPRVTIESPAAGISEQNNTFGSWGAARGIPASSDLWLVVRSGVEGRYYPIDNLTLMDGKWSIRSNWICPAGGLQDIQVYLVPNTDENDLFDYIRSRGPHQGINSMPSQAVLEASSDVQVAGNPRPSC